MVEKSTKMGKSRICPIVWLVTLAPLFTALILPRSIPTLHTGFSVVHKSTLFVSDPDLSTIEHAGDPHTSAGFDLNTALFCGGLAFDAYLEPPANSSRWERGSKGMNVAFLSQAFTRNLYKGLVEGEWLWQ